MRVNYEELSRKNLYIWGNGNLVRRYIHQFPEELLIEAVIDSDVSKHGQTDICYNNCKLDCINVEEMNTSNSVIVALENPKHVSAVETILNSRNMNWCHIFDVVDAAFLSKINRDDFAHAFPAEEKIAKFIDVRVPISSCNLRCRYCYLGQNNTQMDHLGAFYHNPLYIRKALSRKRLGGCAFINLCGVGETLLCRELLPIVDELIKEGHYVQIVTNATIETRVDEFISSDIDFSHLFFKCSLHYNEFKQRNLLNIFRSNVDKIRARGGSFTVEVVPTDDLVESIDEIKEYSLEAFGALPHITVTRNEAYTDFRLLTNYSLEKYKEIWGVFDSKMFDFKIQNLAPKTEYKCKAGLWAGELDLATGELWKCVNNPRLCNIYENLNEDIFFEEIGNGCCMPYCFNNHAYITLGLMPEVDAPTYCEMRDRVTSDGEHWVQEKLRKIFSQKLYENNSRVIN